MSKADKKPTTPNAQKKLRSQKSQSSQKNSASSVLPKNHPKTSSLTWLPKKTFELEFAIPWSKVKKFFDQALKTAASQATIKGFRKGKAPLKLVEKNIDKSKLYQEVLKKLLPTTYVEAIKKHNLRPIMNPNIQPISTQEGKDWQFKATSCETPEVKLNDYQKEVRTALAKEKIWVPGKNISDLSGKPDSPNLPNKPNEPKKPKSPESSYSRRLKTVTTSILRSIEVNLPDILVEDEVNKMLSRFLDQVNRLGMTIDQYLNSKNITSEQLRANYKKSAEDSLKIEFILAEIIKDRSINIEKGEVDKIIKATPDEKARKQLDTPEQRVYIGHILAKRKAIDFLLSL